MPLLSETLPSGHIAVSAFARYRQPTGVQKMVPELMIFLLQYAALRSPRHRLAQTLPQTLILMLNASALSTMSAAGTEPGNNNVANGSAWKKVSRKSAERHIEYRSHMLATLWNRSTIIHPCSHVFVI